MRPISLLSLLAIVAACGPEPEYLEATVDGEVWLAEYVTCIYRADNQELNVSGWRWTGADTKHWIEIRHLPNAVGTVSLAADGPIGVVRDTDPWGWNTESGWITTETFTGTASVTEFDMARRRCSGTFSFVAVPSHGAASDTLDITDGSWTVELSGH
jgi:hypothetical protein